MMADLDHYVKQIGGWKKNTYKLGKDVKDRFTKITPKITPKTTPKTTAKNINSIRSYKAFVNNKQFSENSYYKGTPGAAARKVISMLDKLLNDNEKYAVVLDLLDGQYDLEGPDNAVLIKLVEITRGVNKNNKYKEKKDNFEYEYYGFRERLLIPRHFKFNKTHKGNKNNATNINEDDDETNEKYSKNKDENNNDEYDIEEKYDINDEYDIEEKYDIDVEDKNKDITQDHLVIMYKNVILPKGRFRCFGDAYNNSKKKSKNIKIGINNRYFKNTYPNLESSIINKLSENVTNMMIKNPLLPINSTRVYVAKKANIILKMK
jgi:hypothetical protein